jgi:hypothetical protein
MYANSHQTTLESESSFYKLSKRMPEKFLVEWKLMLIFAWLSGRGTNFFPFSPEAKNPFPHSMLLSTFTSSLKSSPPLHRLCSCYPYMANMHFYVHKEDITNFKKGSVNYEQENIGLPTLELYSAFMQSNFWTKFELWGRNIEGLWWAFPPFFLFANHGFLILRGKNLKGKAEQASRTSNSSYKTTFWWLACK